MDLIRDDDDEEAAMNAIHMKMANRVVSHVDIPTPPPAEINFVITSAASQALTESDRRDRDRAHSSW